MKGKFNWKSKKFMIPAIAIIAIIIITAIALINANNRPVKIKAYISNDAVLSEGQVYDNDDPNINVYATYKDGTVEEVNGWKAEKPVVFEAGKPNTMKIYYKGCSCKLYLSGYYVSASDGTFYVDTPTLVSIYNYYFEDNMDERMDFKVNGNQFYTSYDGIDISIVGMHGKGEKAKPCAKTGKSINGAVLTLGIPESIYNETEDTGAGEEIRTMLTCFVQTNVNKDYDDIEDKVINTLIKSVDSNKQEILNIQNTSVAISWEKRNNTLIFREVITPTSNLEES